MKYFALYESGESFYSEQNFEKSLECFWEAYTMNPSNSVRNYIACCYIGLKKYEEAKKILHSLACTVHWETIQYNLGRVYMQEKQYKIALEHLEEALRINPDNADCYFYLGVYYERVKEYKKAIMHYLQAVERCNEEEEISMYLNNIGICYYNLNAYEKAAHYFDVALEKDATNENAKYNRRLNLLNCKEKNDEN